MCPRFTAGNEDVLLHPSQWIHSHVTTCGPQSCRATMFSSGGLLRFLSLLRRNSRPSSLLLRGDPAPSFHPTSNQTGCLLPGYSSITWRDKPTPDGMKHQRLSSQCLLHLLHLMSPGGDPETTEGISDQLRHRENLESLGGWMDAWIHR